jgi:hypothetical protein
LVCDFNGGISEGTVLKVKDTTSIQNIIGNLNQMEIELLKYFNNSEKMRLLIIEIPTTELPNEASYRIFLEDVLM